jgi:hypothetical protein
MAKKQPSKSTTEAPSAEVTVRVLSAAVGENGTTHLQGETFTTTAARASALGDSVEIIA